MKSARNCNGQTVRKHGYADGRKSYYDCRDAAKWRIEFLAEPKVGKPQILHQMTACSAHLVQILTQAKALALHGDVHVLAASESHEWYPELEDR